MDFKNTVLVLAVFILFINQSFALKNYRKEIHLEKKNLEENKNLQETNENIGTCHGFKCGPGMACILDEVTHQPKCACILDCATVTDPRRKVCSNYNTTWQSDCHLHKHRCICLESKGLSDNCLEEHKHMHIDYYGECTDSLKCEESTLLDFPRRMSEWLNLILTSEHTNIPENNTNDHDLAHKWVDAVIWKYCDLDVEPQDRYVSRHELFPLRAPLLSMEPCIAEFLNKCDADSDHKITLKEWGHCLGAKDGEIEDKCNTFKAIIHKEHSLNP